MLHERKLATTDARSCEVCGSPVRVVSDRDGTSYYTPVAPGKGLAEAVLAADARLADLDAQGSPSRLVELAVWDQIVQLARRVLA